MLKLIIFSVIVLSASLQAESAIRPPCDISVSYFGRNFTHPGMKLSASGELLGDWENTFRLSLQASLGFYYHRSNHTALYISGDIAPSLDFGRSSKWYTALPLGVGYMRTFIDGRVYSISETGDIRRRHFSGNNYLMPFAGITVGRKVQGSRFSRFFLSIGVFGQYPFNSYMLPNIYLEGGFSLGKALIPNCE